MLSPPTDFHDCSKADWIYNIFDGPAATKKGYKSVMIQILVVMELG